MIPEQGGLCNVVRRATISGLSCASEGRGWYRCGELLTPRTDLGVICDVVGNFVEDVG